MKNPLDILHRPELGAMSDPALLAYGRHLTVSARCLIDAHELAPSELTSVTGDLISTMLNDWKAEVERRRDGGKIGATS